MIKDNIYCVDFSTRIPNCIALYLLLIAQKLPANKRVMTLDIGVGEDRKPLEKVLESLRILDNNWEFTIR